MRRFTGLFAILLVLLIPRISDAQYAIASSNARTDWAFEASLFGNWTHLNLGQLNDHISNAPPYYNDQTVYVGYDDINELGNLAALDVRLGFRYRNVHFGGGFKSFGENEGGYTLMQNPSGFQIVERDYAIKIASREFFGYAGYLHPISSFFSVGPMISYGFGTISGSLSAPCTGSDSDPLIVPNP